MTHFCEYYIQQGQADNHAVREAACHCISELCEKVASVQPDPMWPFVDDLLACLIDCFKDESWPVRDSACVSTGKFVKTFPEESSPWKDELFELWFNHLSDNINSVWEHSAEAICDVLTVYEEETKAKILHELDSNLMKAWDQPQDSKKNSNLEPVTQFGVAPMRQHDHEN